MFLTWSIESCLLSLFYLLFVRNEITIALLVSSVFTAVLHLACLASKRPLQHDVSSAHLCCVTCLFVEACVRQSLFEACFSGTHVFAALGMTLSSTDQPTWLFFSSNHYFVLALGSVLSIERGWGVVLAALYCSIQALHVRWVTHACNACFCLVMMVSVWYSAARMCVFAFSTVIALCSVWWGESESRSIQLELIAAFVSGLALFLTFVFLLVAQLYLEGLTTLVPLLILGGLGYYRFYSYREEPTAPVAPQPQPQPPPLPTTALRNLHWPRIKEV